MVMRTRLLLVALVALLLTTSAHAAYYRFAQVTIPAASTALPAALITPGGGIPPMTYVDCRLRTAQISILWVDPAVTTVTAAVGQLMEVGDRLILTNRELIENFRAIRTGGSSGQLDCMARVDN